MKTPKILNILGLAVAIAAFMVVAMVRYYDLRYDKSYPGADRIYRCRPHLLGVAHENHVPRQRYDSELCTIRRCRLSAAYRISYEM